MALRWRFYDPTVPEEYVFEVGPDSGGSPEFAKTITEEATVAPGGKTLIFEGADQPQHLEFSGTLLSQEQYEAFVTWWSKRRQIRITDDMGREFWVYITRFTPKRERAIHSPYKHSYSITCTILDWEPA
jgi:hypothetical protein